MTVQESNQSDVHVVQNVQDGELLLQEPSDNHLPTFRHNAKRFDERMESLGFSRSPTQLDTPADGDCFLHAALDTVKYFLYFDF